MLGKGPEPCDVMIIGEAPGEYEDETGQPFVGRSGKLLDEMLKNVGLKRDKIYITNAVNCRPPSNRAPKTREIDACRKWLKYQLAMVKPKYVMLMGNIPLQSMLKTKGIRKYRGRPIEHEGMIVLPTYHPAYVLRNDRRDQELVEKDLKSFKDIIEFGGIPRERAVNSTIVDTWAKVDAMCEALTGVVSCDLETTCLYPWAPKAKVVTLGFGTRQAQWNVPVNHRDSPWTAKDIERIVERVTECLDDCINVFQNGKFDCLWMLVHYGALWRNDFDTMLAHYLINENSLHDLETLAKLYFGAHGWDIPLADKQGAAPFPKIADYHSHDLYYTRNLYFKLKKELADDSEVGRVFYHLLMPASRLFVEMENRGCYVDVKRMGEVEQYLLKKMATANKQLKKWGDINWASPQQVANLLYNELGITCPMKTKKGANSTAESALNMIEHPAVESLLIYRGAKQQHSFFIEGWKPFIIKSRIHPSFKLHGTVTGRPSCEHPNFQQVPRDPKIRSLITAPEGWELFEGDLSQIELRIVAELSRCPSMVSAFRNGIDIHWKTALNELERYVGESALVIHTASKIKGKSVRFAEAIEILLKAGPDAASDVKEEWKEIRKKAKAINFGYVYGMWWKKFMRYAKDNYGLDLTPEEAQQSRINFFQLYPLEDWHRKQQRYARWNGFVRSLTGRKRRLPQAMSSHDTPERGEAWRQAVNAPVQSFASDINIMLLLEMRKEFPRSVYQPTITVHDAILAEVRTEHVKSVVKRYEEIARGPELFKIFGIEMDVPIMGETKIGPWGSSISLKRWLAS